MIKCSLTKVQSQVDIPRKSWDTINMRKFLALVLLVSSIANADWLASKRVAPPKPEPVESPLKTIKPDDPDMIRVAVIDTGFDVNHPMVGALYSVKLQICDNGTSRFNFVVPEGQQPNDDVKDDHGHGTHVAGLIAKYAGLAPICIMPMKYYDANGRDILNLDRTLASIKKAIELNADIINYSGGGIAPSAPECAAVKEALDKGIVFVTVSGNERSDITLRKFWPAMCDPRVIAVTAKDTFGNRLPSSNYSEDGKFEKDAKTNGTKVKLKIEEGNDMLSTLPGGQYGYMTGTSQAAAVMSGKLANHLFILRKSEYGRYLIKKAPGWAK